MAALSPPSTLENILVYLDGTPGGEAGLSFAMRIAQASGASLLLLNVVDSTPGAHPRPIDVLSIEMARIDAARSLHAVAARLSGQGPEASTHPKINIRMETAEGRPPNEILQIARRESVDLIVLASRSSPHSGAFCLGSTEGTVATQAHQSLLVVRADSDDVKPQAPRIDRMLVLLDGSIAAESSLPTALELARQMGTEIVLAQVTEPPGLPTSEPLTREDAELFAQLARRRRELGQAYLHKLERNLRKEGLYCRTVLRESESIRQGVLALAEEEDVDLILLTSHGHTLNENVVQGGVAQQVLMHAQRPVWLVQNVHRAKQEALATPQHQELRLNH